MMTIYGKYTNAIVYADIIDEETKAQIKVLTNQEFMKDIKVRIMADCHKGTGCVIGTTIEIKDKIVPNLVGVDIGCGMLTINLGVLDIDFSGLDSFIHNNIPSGMNVNQNITKSNVNIEELKCIKDINRINYLMKSLGSLGGDNHFIEIDINSLGEYYLVIHSGSRNLGVQVASIYQNKAIQYHENKVLNKKKEIERVIYEYKKQGKEKEIQKGIDRIKQTSIELSIPKELCYLEGSDFDDYIYDMAICQKFARENRLELARRIVNYLGLDIEKLKKFETIHNYINMKDKILRKGAISAYSNELVLIPLNMRDGCIIARGKSNKEFNYSACHGAGRVMSRADAFRVLNVDDFKKSMEGIYSSTVDKQTLDESPFVYKPIESILNNIKETVEVIEIIKPVYNFKSKE